MHKIEVYFIIIAGFFSCKSQSKEVNWPEIYKDSVFLNIEGGKLEDLFIKAKVDHTIYYQAVQRMNRGLSIKSDTLFWNIKNGAEVKISENIYNYITFMWSLDNKKLKSDTIYEIRRNLKDSTYFVIYKDAPEGEAMGKKIYQ